MNKSCYYYCIILCFLYSQKDEEVAVKIVLESELEPSQNWRRTQELEIMSTYTHFKSILISLRFLENYSQF